MRRSCDTPTKVSLVPRIDVSVYSRRAPVLTLGKCTAPPASSTRIRNQLCIRIRSSEKKRAEKAPMLRKDSKTPRHLEPAWATEMRRIMRPLGVGVPALPSGAEGTSVGQFLRPWCEFSIRLLSRVLLPRLNIVTLTGAHAPTRK